MRIGVPDAARGQQLARLVERLDHDAVGVAALAFGRVDLAARRTAARADSSCRPRPPCRALRRRWRRPARSRRRRGRARYARSPCRHRRSRSRRAAGARRTRSPAPRSGWAAIRPSKSAAATSPNDLGRELGRFGDRAHQIPWPAPSSRRHAPGSPRRPPRPRPARRRCRCRRRARGCPGWSRASWSRSRSTRRRACRAFDFTTGKRTWTVSEVWS